MLQEVRWPNTLEKKKKKLALDTIEGLKGDESKERKEKVKRIGIGSAVKKR